MARRGSKSTDQSTRSGWANLIACDAPKLCLRRRVEEQRGLIGRAREEEDENYEQMI
jgi:hypothetical protein